ncbi:MAG: hypothetical protein AABP62_30435 [Planctomycetota bacterium]
MDNISPSQSPRSPNSSEIKQLASWLQKQGYDANDAALTARAAYVAVYDNYVTCCPGYCGKLISVVWDGSPDCFDVFTWCEGKMLREDRDDNDSEVQ